ncbi:MAG: hypothetical protein LPK28_03355, partial [Bacteroidota bacterium]|nr:hypothetical protein [Bacteroidota bacterium]
MTTGPVTDLGLTVRGGAGQEYRMVTTNLRTAKPEPGVSVTFYNFQHNPIGASLTGEDGTAIFRTKELPYLAVARKGDHTTYLRIDPGSSLNLSAFDTYGKTVKGGLKAFIYGERGVWRPGDTLHLAAMIEDVHERLPKGHPLILELEDPTGKVVRKMVKKFEGKTLVGFSVPTFPEDKTGFYVARLKIGSSEFTERLRLETVKPNRLKISMRFAGDVLSSGTTEKVELEAKWLTGLQAGAYKATVEMDLSSDRGGFESYPDHIFYDEWKRFDWRSDVVFDGKLEANGKKSLTLQIDEFKNAPGLLKAGFNVKVFEPGGDFSIYREVLSLAPYRSMVGFKPPKTEVSQPWLTSGETYRIPEVKVNGKGEMIKTGKVRSEVFKIDWRWWWSSENGRNAAYMNREFATPVKEEVFSLSEGMGIFAFKVPTDDWGRYYVRFTDEESGHSTGTFMYFDWPMGRDRSGRKGQEAVTELVFASEKESYKVGEQITLRIPTTTNGKLLVCLDKGSGPYKHLWVDGKAGMTEVTFPAEAGMAPTLYAYVMEIQPYEQTLNDLPLRLYGVIPIGIENEDSRLSPIIKTPSKFKPNERYSIEVSEKDGKPMSYTLAIVDEGLLDLTRFKTPQPWDHFYGREAYTVMTWDMFDEVMGAFGGKIDQLLAVGGDEDMSSSKAKNNLRFKPVVQFTGPIHLDKGEQRTHSFIMPNYVGSVRVMVIAGREGRYGSADKAVPVTQPLMTLATLPRVAGLGERITLPVTVFVMEDNAPKEVEVELELKNIKADVIKKKLKTPEKGTYTIDFDLTSPSTEGVASIKVITRGGGQSSFDEVKLPVRNPVPTQTLVKDISIPSGESVSLSLKEEGQQVVSWKAELSSIPFFSPAVILSYLNEYPYGCTEQRLSRMMSQLVAARIFDLEQPEMRKRMADMNRYLQTVQGSEGGFRLWPGQTFPDGWVTSMAGHYMFLSDRGGVPYPESRVNAWLGYQQRRAREWSMPNQYQPYGESPAGQAYRLYTLVLHDRPEVGAMNRLRLQTGLNAPTLALLAAAYSKMGQSSVAGELKTRWAEAVKPERYYRYGSLYRDQLIMGYVAALLGDMEGSYESLRSTSERFAQVGSFNTQEGLWAMLATEAYLGGKKLTNVQGSWSAGGKPLSDGKGMLWTANGRSPEQGSVIKANNEASVPLNLRVIRTLRPQPGKESAYSKGLTIKVEHLDLNGKPIDPSSLKQGQEVRMRFTVEREQPLPLHDLALRVRIPSGWEIRNDRMSGVVGTTVNQITYEDFRDDHIDVFFDLNNGSKQVFEYRFTATYAGRFYLPPMRVEAMYEPGTEAQN